VIEDTEIKDLAIIELGSRTKSWKQKKSDLKSLFL
jgi:hypothetical protein